MTNAITIQGIYGTTFEVRIVETGDAYGLDNCLVNDGGRMVEFYDVSVSTENFPNGQFVSGYYVDTLLEDRNQIEDRGLDLDGGVTDWTVGGSEMAKVMDFITA